jgi:hypothetical protein
MNINEEFYQTYEWKGTELQPFSEARRSVAMSVGVRLGGDLPPSILDIHILLYILLSDKKELVKAHRNPDAFISSVLDWADKNITPADYEEEAKVVGEVIRNSNITAATIVEDGAPGEPMGN